MLSYYYSIKNLQLKMKHLRIEIQGYLQLPLKLRLGLLRK